MRKLFASAAVALVVASSALPANAQLAVFDGANAANTAQSIIQLKAQLDQLKSTYDTVTNHLAEAKRMTAAVTGVRNLGDVFNNPAIRQYLPGDVKRIYDKASLGGYAGISGSVDEILKAEGLTGTTAEKMASIQERQRRSAATTKLIGEDAFEGARQRLAQLDQLQSKINQTEDPKAIADLQARIAIEQANMQNESTKLQLLQMMAQAEERLAAQQSHELSGRIMGRGKTAMGRIQ